MTELLPRSSTAGTKVIGLLFDSVTLVLGTVTVGDVVLHSNNGKAAVDDSETRLPEAVLEIAESDLVDVSVKADDVVDEPDASRFTELEHSALVEMVVGLEDTKLPNGDESWHLLSIPKNVKLDFAFAASDLFGFPPNVNLYSEVELE